MTETAKKSPEEAKSPENRFEAMKKGLVKGMDYYAGWAREYLNNRQDAISASDFIDLMENVGCTLTQNDLDTDLPDADAANPSVPNKNLAEAVLRAQVNMGFGDSDCDGMLGPQTCAALIEKKKESVKEDAAEDLEDLKDDVGGADGTAVEVSEANLDILDPEKVVWMGTSVDVGILNGTEVKPLGGEGASSKKMWKEFEALSADEVEDKIVVIGSTGNDSYDWEKTKKYLDQIVQKARNDGAIKVVMQNRVPYGAAFTRAEYVERAKTAREGQLKAWGDDSFVQLVDMYAEFAGDDGYMLEELVDETGWHPNAKAYAMMRDYLVAEINEQA